MEDVKLYFVSYADHAKEYQVWNNAQVVYRNKDANKVIQEIVGLLKQEPKPIFHFIPPTQNLEKMLEEVKEVIK